MESERGVHLRVLLSRMDRIAGRAVQRIGLSATTGNPGEVLRWLSEGRHGQRWSSVPATPQEKHFRFIIEPEESRRTEALVRIVSGRKALVFVNSRSGAEEMVRSLSGQGPEPSCPPFFSLSGNKEIGRGGVLLRRRCLYHLYEHP